MSLKQEILAGAREHRPARPAWYGESYTAQSLVSEGLIARPIGKAPETDTNPTGALNTCPGNLQGCQRWTMRPLKRRTGHLPHASTCHVADHGIAYRARAPRQRSPHSSPRWG